MQASATLVRDTTRGFGGRPLALLFQCLWLFLSYAERNVFRLVLVVPSYLVQCALPVITVVHKVHTLVHVVHTETP